jgi:hypothetical protein
MAAKIEPTAERQRESRRPLPARSDSSRRSEASSFGDLDLVIPSTPTQRLISAEGCFYLVACLAGLAPCPAIVVGFRGDPWFGSLVAVVLCGTCVLGVLLLCLLLWLKKRKSKGPLFDSVEAHFAAWLGILMLGAVASVPVARFVQGRDVRAAKLWAEQTVAPGVDSYFSKTGAYPARVEDVVDFEHAPYLWRASRVLYKHNEKYYSMDVVTSRTQEKYGVRSTELGSSTTRVGQRRDAFQKTVCTGRRPRPSPPSPMRRGAWDLRGHRARHLDVI